MQLTSQPRRGASSTGASPRGDVMRAAPLRGLHWLMNVTLYKYSDGDCCGGIASQGRENTARIHWSSSQARARGFSWLRRGAPMERVHVTAVK